ncbi:MAG: Hcp family type VI secretion system effector [Pyrinomonadaceae bacterium]
MEDFYLKIDTIDGEAEATGLDNHMQIQSFSFGATNPGSARQGTGMGSGKVSLQDFHFTIDNGKASLPLFLATCKGNHIPSAFLTCRKTGGDGNPYTYLKVTFNDLVISSWQTGGHKGSGLPTEQCSFNFTKITHEYFQQKADGSVSFTNTVSYDIEKVEGSGA